MYIKIVKCSNEEYWYKKYVGKVFEPSFFDTVSNSYVVEKIDGTPNTMGSIFEGDFEEVSQFDESEIFVPPTPPKTEEQLKYEKIQAELEITQTALNEILMNTLGGM